MYRSQSEWDSAEPQEVEFFEAQLSAAEIARRFERGELEDLQILDQVDEQAEITDVIHLQADDEGPEVVQVEWAYSEWESPGERVRHSGVVELAPGEKFNIQYR